MLPICDKLDRVGYWSLEVWGGATFDACVRFLKEDPGSACASCAPRCPTRACRCSCARAEPAWLPPLQRRRGARLVAKAAVNGIDVFRIFDAMNDVRNLRVAIEAVKAAGKHAQGTLSYTTSPVHTVAPTSSRPGPCRPWASTPSRSGHGPACSPLRHLRAGQGAPGRVDLPVFVHSHDTSGMGAK